MRKDVNYKKLRDGVLSRAALAAVLRAAGAPPLAGATDGEHRGPRA